jgi:hypothetical protein
MISEVHSSACKASTHLYIKKHSLSASLLSERLDQVIHLDKTQYQKEVEWASNQEQPDLREIQVYLMKEPDASARIYSRS